MLVFERKECTPVFYLIEAAFLEPNLSILNKKLYFFFNLLSVIYEHFIFK